MEIEDSLKKYCKKYVVNTSEAADSVRGLGGGWNFEEDHVAKRLTVVPDNDVYENQMDKAHKSHL